LLRAKVKYEQRDASGEEERRETSVVKHDNPMQVGLILHRFAGDQMFFDVGQGKTSRARSKSAACRANLPAWPGRPASELAGANYSRE
jgi:hypothetical protein